MNDSDGDPAPPAGIARFITRVYGWRPVRYILVGGTSFAVDFGLLFVLHELLSVVAWLAAGIAFVTSFLVNYTLQRRVSFVSTAPHGPSLVRYLILVAANTIITSVLVQLFASISIGWAIGKIVTTVITSVVNYFVYKHWIFPASRNQPAA